MKIQLHEFQSEAVRELLGQLKAARNELKLDEHAKDQVLVLSAPTGSGKTVIMSALIEAVLDGGHPGDEASEFPDKEASFLWITDQPQLNTQTKSRMESYLDNIWFGGKIEEIDDSYDGEQLEPGKLYFINTQKLGKKGRLVNRGDKRQHTFWDTMHNTVKDRPTSMYVIIDEAHRGMEENAERKTIVQRFIKGDSGRGMPAVPIIIGVSATPERFKELLKGTDRIDRLIEVDPGEVQRSGLLKESILLRHSSSPVDSEMTLLRGAVGQFLRYEKAWADHCSWSGDNEVRPIMLVQVEDASKADQKHGRHSATDIAEALGVISGELRDGGASPGPGAFAHAFQDAKMLDVAGTDLRGLAPADIVDDDCVRVVFFKRALDTGWDCPRAEVMMSFRAANDPTHIAQLVGRMVRTPLGKRIEGEHSDLLNAVDLYLPKYDEKGLDAVIRHLTDEAKDTRTPARVVSVVDLKLNCALPKAEECRALLERLPTYEMPRQRRLSELARLMKVARCLQRGPDSETTVLKDATEIALRKMSRWLLDRLEQRRPESQFETALKEAGLVEIKTTRIPRATPQDGPTGSSEPVDRPGAGSESKSIADRDLRQKIARADRELGEGLASALVRDRERRIANENSGIANDALRQARLDVLALLAVERHLKDDLDHQAYKLIKQWEQDYDDEIEKLSDREYKDLKVLLAPEGEPQPVESSRVAKRISRRREKSEQSWDKHLYVEEDGQYFAKLNGWEKHILSEELEREDVVAWFRNKLGVDRWRLAVPYSKGGDTHLMYPDMIVFRQSDDGLVADILDPHGLHLADAVAKAHGLAVYAKDHKGPPLGRVEAIAKVAIKQRSGVVKKRMRRLDLSDPDNQNAVMGCDSIEKVQEIMASIKLADNRLKLDSPVECEPPDPESSEQPRDSGDEGHEDDQFENAI